VKKGSCPAAALLLTAEFFLPLPVKLAVAAGVEMESYFLLSEPLEMSIRKNRNRPIIRCQNEAPWNPCR
jgi:hypothetical protein